jgi:NADPH:quinone reductase-like Zn-dependent oxidoreductase
MKAIVYHKYGSPDIHKLEEVKKPTPTDDEVLVKGHAVSVILSDWEGLRGKPFYARIGGLFKPKNKILGSNIAGRVEAAGKDVKQFQPGDEVFGLMWGYKGGFAEYACAPEKALALKPAGMTFEAAATIPQAAVIAL